MQTRCVPPRFSLQNSISKKTLSILVHWQKSLSVNHKSYINYCNASKTEVKFAKFKNVNHNSHLFIKETNEYFQ